MKKGFLVSVAICSLLLMAACGGNGTAKEAAAETKTTAEQPADKAAEPKTEAEAAPAAETEPAAEPEQSSEASEGTVSEADKAQFETYRTDMTQVLEDMMSGLQALLDVETATNNQEDIETILGLLKTANESFVKSGQAMDNVTVPKFESQALQEDTDQIHKLLRKSLDTGVAATSNFIEGLDKEDEAKIEEATGYFDQMKETVPQVQPILQKALKMIGE